MRKQFISILLIVGFVMGIGFSVFYLLNEEEKVVEKKPIPKRIKIIKNTIQEPKIKSTDKEEVEVKIEDIFAVEEIPENMPQIINLNREEKNELRHQEIQEQLQIRMDDIYQKCQKFHTQKEITAKLQELNYEDVFLSDMHGDTYYGSNDTEDIYARTIILEEIQKVGKYGEGFILSSVDSKGMKRYIFVKDLKVKKLFLGVEIYTDEVY